MSEGCKLFVGNLSYDASEEDVRKAFQSFQPSEVIIITDRETGRPRGFGFVTLPEDQAEAAKSEMNGFSLLGRNLTVNDAAKKSGGGGGGGYRGGDRGDRGYQNRSGGYNQGGYNQGGYGGGGYQQRDQGGYGGGYNRGYDNY